MNVWIQLAILALSIYLQVAMQPTPTEPKAAAFADIEIPQIEEGTPQAVIFGDMWSGDWMVLATGNFSTTAIKANGSKKG